MSALAKAIAVLLALQVAHTLDHALIQPARDYTWQINAAGVAGLIATGLALALAVRRSRLAPPFAAFVGTAVALGFLAAHLLPYWGAFSDPYPDLDLNAVSWALLFVPMASAVLVVALALRRPTSAAQPA